MQGRRAARLPGQVQRPGTLSCRELTFSMCSCRCSTPRLNMALRPCAVPLHTVLPAQVGQASCKRTVLLSLSFYIER